MLNLPLVCRTLGLEGQSLSLQTETGKKWKDCVFLALAGFMCIANNVLNLHLRILEAHELNTHLCEVRQELLPCNEN